MCGVRGAWGLQQGSMAQHGEQGQRETGGPEGGRSQSPQGHGRG